MPKLRIEDLAKIQEQTKRVTNIRNGAGSAKVIVHMGTCGIAAGARNVMSAARNQKQETLFPIP